MKVIKNSKLCIINIGAIVSCKLYIGTFVNVVISASEKKPVLLMRWRIKGVGGLHCLLGF